MRSLTVPFRAALASVKAALLAIGLAGAAGAAEEAPAPPAQAWSFHGVFGTYDRAELQRGLQVYLASCASCHSMDLLAFRHLADLGFTEEELRALAAQFTIEDGPDDMGDMFTRPRLPSDPLPNPFPNPQAARAANSGALPPDLSVIAKARDYGPDYVYAFLTGFVEPPADVELRPGMSYNAYFPGHQVAMPNILTEGGADYADGTPATVERQARDVTAFLMWAAEPHMEARKATGIRVMLFLIVFAGVLYAAKRKVWTRLH